MAARKRAVRRATVGAGGTRVYFGRNPASTGGNRRVARETRAGQRTTRAVRAGGVRITGQRSGASTASQGRIRARNVAVFPVGSNVAGTQKRFMAAGRGRTGYVATRRGAVALRQG